MLNSRTLAILKKQLADAVTFPVMVSGDEDFLFKNGIRCKVEHLFRFEWQNCSAFGGSTKQPSKLNRIVRGSGIVVYHSNILIILVFRIQGPIV